MARHAGARAICGVAFDPTPRDIDAGRVLLCLSPGRELTVRAQPGAATRLSPSLQGEDGMPVVELGLASHNENVAIAKLAAEPSLSM